MLGGTAFGADGLITTQLLRTDGAWRILSMAWDDEREGVTLPPQERAG